MLCRLQSKETASEGCLKGCLHFMQPGKEKNREECLWEVLWAKHESGGHIFTHILLTGTKKKGHTKVLGKLAVC